MIDDVGWTDVGFHNGSGMLTPTLDNLAATGIELVNYYVQPVCSPTRSAFMTGRYPFHTGMQHFETIKPASKARLPPEDPTIAELLAAEGWQPHAVGKWHLGYASWRDTPTARGFLSHVGFFQGMEDYFDHNFSVPSSLTPVPINGYDFFRNQSLSWADKGKYALDIFNQEITQVLSGYVAQFPSAQQQQAHPLYFYVAHQIVHIPLEAPTQYMQRCTAIQNQNRRVYCAMMAALDDSLALLVKQLQNLALWDNTLLVISSDNGGMVDYGVFPASAGCNYPFRAGKGTLFEGGVKAVAIIQGGSSVIPAASRGTKSAALAHAVDWASTLMALANSSRVPKTFDGFNLWPAFTNASQPSPRTDIPLNINYHVGFPDSGMQAGVLKDGWKLIISKVKGATLNYDGWYPPPPLQPSPAPPAPSDGMYLFDLSTDPFEHNNLFDQMPQKAQELLSLLQQYNQTYQPPQDNSVIPAGLPILHDGAWLPWVK